MHRAGWPVNLQKTRLCRRQRLILWHHDMGCACNTRSLHVAFSTRLQRADLKVSVNCPPSLWPILEIKMQFRCFIIEAKAIVTVAISIAVDAVDVVSPDLPESR